MQVIIALLIVSYAAATAVRVNDPDLTASPVSWDSVSWLGSANASMYRADFTVPSGASLCVLHIFGLGYSS